MVNSEIEAVREKIKDNKRLAELLESIERQGEIPSDRSEGNFLMPYTTMPKWAGSRWKTDR